MKSEAITRTGIIDALGTGLTEAARRPWLWIIPIVVDLALWFAPRLSISALAARLVDHSQAFLEMIYTPGQMAATAEGIDLVRTNFVETAKWLNLGSALTAGWVAPPSALAQFQPTRYLMISDAVLAPLNLRLAVKPLAAPWQMASIEVNSAFVAVAIVAVLWLIGQLLAALYFRMTATSLQSRPVVAKPGPGVVRRLENDHESSLAHGWLPLAGRFAALSFFALFGTFMLLLPLALVALLALFSGSGAAGTLFVLGGGLTLWLAMWFLSSLFFVGDALAFDHLPLWASLIQSLILVRGNAFRVLVLAAVVNVLMLGARAVWAMLGSNPTGALFAIILNGYLATAMTIGIFLYYQDLRRHWQAAQLGRQLS